MKPPGAGWNGSLRGCLKPPRNLISMLGCTRADQAGYWPLQSLRVQRSRLHEHLRLQSMANAGYQSCKATT